MVDCGVLPQPREVGHELCRGRFQPTDMFEQEGHYGFLVLRVVGCTSVLVFFERVLDLLGKFGDLLLLRGHDKFHQCRTGGKDEVLEALRFGGNELCRQHSTPRIAQQVEIVGDFDVLEEEVEFGYEELEPFFSGRWVDKPPPIWQ